MTSNEALKKFRSSFEKASYRHSYSVTFNAFLDFCIIMLSVVPQDGNAERAKRLDSMFKEEDAKHFADMFQYWQIASENDGKGFFDALGELFMDLVSHGRAGQFFTPQDICTMMAELTYGDQIQTMKTVADPCCGSGRMLLAMAKKNRNLIFYAADIDPVCCKMTLLNMVINTMVGEIAWMDSLSLEHFGGWSIKKMLTEDNFFLPYFYERARNENKLLIPAA